jgi:twitching motility protein PilT
MRVIATKIPTLADLNLPPSLGETAGYKNGIVLVTGPTGSGKSSTLAALIDVINENRAEHIITIEDPVEFLHLHKKGTIHQRELHSDTPTFALALRAALRQAPKVILVGEMRDRETIEIALTAAETGHLVFSTLHTIDALEDDRAHRRHIRASDQTGCGRASPRRSARSCRSVWCAGRAAAAIAVLEILKSTMRTKEYVEKGEGEGRSLVDAMRDGSLDGMQSFDGELERLAREGTISVQTALLYASNPGDLRLTLGDLDE